MSVPTSSRWLFVRTAFAVFASLAGASLLAACASSPVEVPESGRPGPLPAELAPFTGAGTYAVSLSAGQFVSEFGCSVEYEVFEPADIPQSAAGNVTVVLGHGFQSNLSAMRGWAQQWASHGVRTAVLSFCNSSWFNGRHDRNAADMVALADLLLADRSGAGPVIYAGFSAGGLSALLAAQSDPRAVAYLGLDAVDSGHLAAQAAGLSIPALFLFAEPAPCNADGNMRPFAGNLATATSLVVPFATHCDFQNPYSTACERFCGSVAPPETAARIRETILAVATAWVVDQALREGSWTAREGDNIVDMLRDSRRADFLAVAVP